MEMRNIKTFLIIAELKSFSKAASHLAYAQSTVTVQIQQLEEELGVPLFERIAKRIRLTKAGEEFLPYAQSILSIAEDSKRKLKNLPMESGELRLVTTSSICTTVLPKVLDSYHQKYPNVSLRVFIADTKEMLSMLRHNEVDLLYTLDRRVYLADLITSVEYEEEIIFVASPKYHMQGSIILLADLVKEKFLLTEKNMSYRRHLEERLALLSLEIEPFLECGNVEILKKFVEEGAGISFLPKFTVTSEIKAQKLVKINVQGERFFVHRQLLYHRAKWLTPPMEAMIETVRRVEEEIHSE